MIVVVGLVATAAYLIIKPRLDARLAQAATFSKAKGGRPDVTVHINGMPVKALTDTGSDLTLLTHTDGTKLGLVSPNCEKLPVSGISDTAESFCKVHVVMKIGDTQPFKTFVGVAAPGNPLRDTLLGSKDLDRFHVTISPHEIKFSQAHTACDSGVCMTPPAPTF